ncbi:MAG: branched-chain amino acid ABC transporter permease [Hyphomicrobiales bacterium]|nr:branched-chain amino acid ABC transporter permease [Hyphomicrobiales bacterium]MBV8662890.1 branched-chain amino acid ABC transporter permease [Hyphomicrobiales bacterium]
MRFFLILLAAFAIAGCARLVETDQARLCRMALPALEAPDAAITILKQTAFPDGRGLRVDYRVNLSGRAPESRFAECRFRLPGRPKRSEDLVGLTTKDGPLSDVRLAILIRYWLATPEARAADPAPLGDVAALPAVPAPLAYGMQQAINGLPLAAVYALLAAAYSLVYGLVGRINLAFGDIAAVGGYAAALGAAVAAAQPPAGTLAVALGFGAASAAFWGVAASRWVFQPLGGASGQQVLIASIGLALALGEFLRLTQGNRPNWVGPVLNAPFGVARSGDFIVTTAPNALLAGAFALAAGFALVFVMQKTRFGRRWRAYADDPLGAQLFGVSPGAIFGQTFALASAFAGLSGFVMTMYYGSVGYGAATSLGLKALIAAILGGVGSIPGAFLGGFVVGAFEAAWSTYFAVDYRDVAVFSLLAILLTLRPGGILGAAEPPVRR